MVGVVKDCCACKHIASQSKVGLFTVGMYADVRRDFFTFANALAIEIHMYGGIICLLFGT
jgi:hypothetical protein